MSALTASLDSFLGHLAGEKRYSPHTVSSYRRDLEALCRFLDERGCRDWGSLNTAQLRRFIALRHEGGLQGRSLQRQLSAIRSFFRFMRKQGWVDHDPAADVAAPKAPARLPATVEHEQVERLLAVDAREPLAVRDKAIMELFYSSGLRLAEIVGLDCEHLDLVDGLVRIERGKGGKTRVVPVGRAAREALRAWLGRRADFLKPGVEPNALFLSRNGTRLGCRAIQQRLRYWARKQGLDQNIHPHRLRHAFASHLLESSGDIRAVQELLGHANIRTTQVYTHLDFQHLAQVYDQAHPRARKRS